MKRIIKTLGIMVLMVSLSTTTLYAAEEDGTYGDRLELVMQMIRENYLENEELSDEVLFEAAMSGMFDLLDPYSVYIAADNATNFTNSLNNTYVGIGVQLIQIDEYVVIDRVFFNGAAEKDGLQVHDKIIEAEGISLIGKTPAEAASIIIGDKGTEVTITIDREGYVFDVTLIRSTVTINAVDRLDIKDVVPKISDEEAERIGYIKIGSFTSTVDDELEEVLKAYKEEGKEYLLIDLRDNGGGFVNSAVNVCRLLIPEGPVLRFIDNKGIETVFESDLKKADFKIVALVNGNSASATEFVAAAISESGIGTLVGETTFGKGVAQYMYTLSDGAVVKLTQEAFYSGNSVKIHGVGVTPEVVVTLPDYLTKSMKFYPNEQHEDVLQVEEMLAYLGYEVGPIDDLYDPVSVEAIKQFQEDQGLWAYGICDYTTQDYMNQAFIKSVDEKDIQLERGIEVLLEQINE